MNPLIQVNFGAMCSSRKYGLKEIFASHDGQSEHKCKALLEWLEEIGTLSLPEVEARDHRHGGFEKIPVARLKDPGIIRPLMELLKLSAVPEQLLDFRFGGSRYRLLAYLEKPACLYVVAMDWDFDLYDHGS